MKLIRKFIVSKVFTIVIFIFMMIVGFISVLDIQIEDEPSAQYKKCNIQVNYASSLDGVEHSIALPIEKRIISIPGVEFVTSDVTTSGANMSIIFAQDTNYYENLLRIQDALLSARSDIPSEANIEIGSDHNADDSIMTLYFSSNSKSISEINTIVDKMKHVLESVNGVSSVVVNSAMDGDTCTVSLRAQDMYVYGVPYDAVRNAIYNLGLTGGTCSVPIGNYVMNVDVCYEDTDIATYPMKGIKDNIICLGEISKITGGSYIKDNIYRVNDHEVVSIDIHKKYEANLISVCKSVRKVFDYIRNICAANDVEFGVLIDKSIFVERGIKSVYKSIVEAIILVAIVIFLFLRSLKISLIPILAIPLSVVPMFTFMRLLGVSINVYSLFGIVLSVGLVVDDAIVVIENIFKYIEAGCTKTQAAIYGTTSILGSIISMTITLAIVYVPILFVNDPQIKNFVDFAIAITVSVLISGFVSISITPMLFDYIYDEHNSHESESSLSSWLDRKYLQILAYLIKHRYSVFIGIYLLFIFLLIACLSVIRYEENIELDRGYTVFGINSKRDNDIDIVYTDKKLSSISEYIRDSYISHDVSDIVTNVNAANKAKDLLRLHLIDHKYRKYSIDQINKKVGDIFKTEASDINIYFASGTNDEKTMVVYMQCYDGSFYNITRRTAQFRDFLASKGLISGIMYTDLRYNNTYKLLINKELCIDYNINPSDLFEALTSMHQNRVFKKPINQHIHKMHLTVDTLNVMDRLTEMLNMPVTVTKVDEYNNHQRKVVPMKTFIKVKKEKQVNKKYRVNGIDGIGITLRLNKGISKTTVNKHVNQFNKDMSGICLVQVSPEETRKIAALHKMMYISLIAVLFIYLIISVLLNSFIEPIAIMLTVPVSSFGGIILLLLTGYKLNVIAIVGLITLIGLITKHGIMILDYVSQNSNNRLLDDVVMEACLSRLRPILMTTICMVLGAIPLATAYNTEFSEYKVPIGLVIIGGMIIGTVLTLFVVPCAYIILVEMYTRNHIVRKNYTELIEDKLSNKSKQKLNSDDFLKLEDIT